MTPGKTTSRVAAWCAPIVGMFFVVTATMKVVDLANGSLRDEDLIVPLSVFVPVIAIEALLGAWLLMRPWAHVARYAAMSFVVVGASVTFALEWLGSDGSCGCFGALTPVLGHAKFAISGAMLAILAVPGIASAGPGSGVARRRMIAADSIT